MSNSNDDNQATFDTVEIDDKNGRRRFFRVGAAFLIAGSGAAAAQEEGGGGRSDCDSQGGVVGKNAEMEGSDGDAGATADRPGCGTKKPPAMTEYNKRDQKIKVGKVIA